MKYTLENETQAAVLEKIGVDPNIRKVNLIEPVEGQVKVKVSMSGLCGSQLQEICGNKGNEEHLPHLLGHEGCGIVEKVGPGVKNVEKGNKVVLHWRKGEGIESDFPKFCKSPSRWWQTTGKCNTLAESVVVSENRVTKIDNDIPDDFAAMLGCSLSTALSVVDNETNLRFGDSVAVIGCGGVGLNLLQALILKGAGKIVAVEQFNSKAQLCRSCGADEFYNFIPNEKFDVIIDTTGDRRIIEVAVQRLNFNGRLILVGQLAQNNPLVILDGNNLINECKKIIPTQGGQFNPSIDIPKYINLYRNNKIDYRKVITHTYELSNLSEAIKKMKEGSAGKIMIRM